jgi:uncharacterized membrane protein
MRWLFIFTNLLICACHQPAPKEIAGITIPPGVLAAAAEQHFDYTGYVAKAAHREEPALARLFSFSEKTDSATSLAHGKVLSEVLAKTGDEWFAAVLSRQGEACQQAVWAAMGAAFDKPIKNAAPQTWSALMPKTEAQEFRGLYIHDAQRSTFRDCDEPGKFYVAKDETGDIGKNYKRLLRYPYPNQPIFAEVKGFKTDHFGGEPLPDNCAGFFVVKEIIDLEVKNFRNTCIPYDLWAMGTEPFWFAQVSAREGIIEFRDMDSERTKVFTYLPPIREDSARVYAAINQDTGDNIRIAVKEQPCSDGMSDRKFTWKVELTMNGKSLSGCGISFGERNVEGQ